MIFNIFIFLIIITLIFYFVDQNITPIYTVINNSTDKYIENFISTGNFF